MTIGVDMILTDLNRLWLFTGHGYNNYVWLAGSVKTTGGYEPSRSQYPIKQMSRLPLIRLRSTAFHRNCRQLATQVCSD